MQSSEVRRSPGLVSRLIALFWACIPWLLTGAVGVWQWQRLSARGTDLRHVVLVAVLLCGVAVLLTVIKAFRPQRAAVVADEGVTDAS